MKKANKGINQQAKMMEMVLGRINDADYYVREAQKERDMKDPSIRFCYDKTANIYHIKNCKEIRDISTENLVACKNIPLKSTICQECYRKAIILHGMDDVNGKIFAYVEFFNGYGVPSSCIKRLTIGNRGKFQIIGEKQLVITIREEDTFKIEYSNKDQAFLIYHNNYRTIDDTRQLSSEFHIEDGGYYTLEEAINKICKYSWEKFHKQGEYREC